jgi:hypothetical protein
MPANVWSCFGSVATPERIRGSFAHRIMHGRTLEEGACCMACWRDGRRAGNTDDTSDGITTTTATWDRSKRRMVRHQNGARVTSGVH